MIAALTIAGNHRKMATSEIENTSERMAAMYIPKGGYA
jgi:hypothetical protein